MKKIEDKFQSIEDAVAHLRSIGGDTPYEEAHKCLDAVRQYCDSLGVTQWPRGTPLHFEYCRAQVEVKARWQAHLRGDVIHVMSVVDSDGWRQWVLANPEADGIDWPGWFGRSERTATPTN